MKGLKKIYYVPGLISAIIIPILFWHYGSQKLNESIPNVMDIGLPPKESDIPIQVLNRTEIGIIKKL